MYKSLITNKKLIISKIAIVLLSILPISMIVGNLALNLNIILINLITLLYCIKNNNWSWIKTDYFKILIILNFYLIINSTFNFFKNDNFEIDGILRSIGFIKFILLFFSMSILISHKDQISKILLFWSIIVVTVIFDVIFEFFFGHNIFGFVSLDQTRIVSFFYDENIVGSFLLCFSFIICMFFIKNNKEFKIKFFLNIFLLIIPISIMLTGERSNFYKTILIFFTIIFLIDNKYLIIKKLKIYFIIISGILLAIITSPTLFIKQTEFFKRILVVEEASNFKDKFQNISYFAHYDTAINIFKDFPINGVGSKNFRVKCSEEKYFNKELKFSFRRCSTHPHQIHFELLSEHGLIGYFLFFYFIFLFMKNYFFKNSSKKDIYTFTTNFYILIFLIPILPSGSLFSTYNGTLFWLILSLANLNNKLLEKPNS